jgi:hypothetical protein
LTSSADAFAEGLMETSPPTKPVVAPKAEPQAKSPTSRSVFSHPEAHPIALDIVLMKNFQLDWLEWLPETLFAEIEHTFKTSIADINRVKILAVQTLHVTDSYWNNWEIFEKTIWALNGMIPQVKVMQPPDLSILMAGVDIANGIRKEKYEEEVSRYCAAVFLNENVHYAPEPLDFCQLHLAAPFYECKDCHKIGQIGSTFDGLCSSCAEHYEGEHPFKFEPDEDALNKGHGKNISIGVVFNPDEIKKRFEELDSMTSDILSSIKETDVDIQAAKLIIATDYMKFKAKQLAEQLTSLRGWLETP